MAHIVASITVFVNAPHYICREGTPLQTQDCPDALFLAANGVAPDHVFWHLHVLPPIGDLLYLIRNKVDY